MTLPPVAAAAIPTDVRAAGADAIETYKSAQGFERMLVERLAQTMTAGSPLAEGPYASAIGQALTDGIAAGGGLGLTDDLYRAMTLGDATGTGTDSAAEPQAPAGETGGASA